MGLVKTSAGRRDLPLLPLAADMLDVRRDVQAADRAELGRAWLDNGLIFTTRTGRPVDIARHRTCRSLLVAYQVSAPHHLATIYGEERARI